MYFYLRKYVNFAIKRIFSLYRFLFLDKCNDIGKMLQFCSKSIKFYKGKAENIYEYNFIDKNIVNKQFEFFIKRGIKIKNTGYTSGTTGTPRKYYRDIKSMASEQYFQGKYFGWDNKYMVIMRGEKIFDPQDKPKKIYKAIPGIKEMYVSSYHLNEQSMEYLYKKLSAIKNKCLWAYPSAAYFFADFCIKKGYRLSFDIVATSSEKLLDHQVHVIEKAFNCKVKDWYGQGERVAALYRCEYGHYHEVPGYSYVEYIHIKEDLYEIVGTNLHNMIMPLVRFRTGDIVTIYNEPCLCRYHGKNIVCIHGRANDCIELPNGTLAGNLLNVAFKKVTNILEAQIIQKRDKRLTVRVVRNHLFNEEDERNLYAQVFSFLPEEITEIEFVPSIERGSNGKYRFVINESA